MPAVPSYHGSNKTLPTFLSEAEQQLLRHFPAHETRIKSLLKSRFAATIKKAHKPTLRFEKRQTSLTQEEIFSVVQKIAQLSQLPGLTFDKETELYLEQQLEDILGFGISATSSSIKLPFVKGTIYSLPHLYSSPTAHKNSPPRIKEAGLDSKRSLFGWRMQPASTDSSTGINDEYWVSLPLRSFVSTDFSFVDIKKWAYKKKLLIINPLDAIYTVAEVMNEYNDPSNKYQIGGSPAVIRDGLFWSPQNLGKVMVFFMSDASNSPPPGVYSLLE